MYCEQDTYNTYPSIPHHRSDYVCKKETSVITIEMIHKNEDKLFYNVKKNPYGCVYKELIYV